MPRNFLRRSIRPIAVFLVLSGVVSIHSLASAAPNVTSGAYIPVATSPTDETYDSTDGLYFVSSFYGPIYSIDANFHLENGSETNVESQIVGSVTTGNGSDGICWDSTNDNIWVANDLSGSVSVINPKSLKVIANFNTGPGVVVPIFDKSLDKVFVTDRNGTLLQFNAETLQIEKVINVGAGAEGVALDPNSQILYVGNTSANSISIVNANSGSITGTIPNVGSAYGLAFNQQMGVIYATDYYNGLLNVIDVRTNQVVQTVTGLTLPWGVSVSQRTNTVYVASRGASYVEALNGYNNSVVGYLSSGSDTVYPMVDDANNVVVTASWQGVIGFFEGFTALPGSPTVELSQPQVPQSLTWNLSESADGGLPIVSYTWSGACSGSGKVTTVTCSGLSGGQQYTLNVTATNANGSSQPVSSTAVAEDVPGAPQLGSGLVVGDHQAQWSWSDDTTNGAPITSYTWSGACSGSGDVTTVTCSNLPGGSTESLSVVATNAMGDSPASSASIAMPITAPDGVAVSVVSGPMGFRASWSAPANGGSPLTGYNVQVLSASGQVVTQQTLPASATSFGATKLTNGATYSFAITATNAALLASTPVVTSNIVPLAEVKLTESAATYSYGAAKSLLTVKVAPTATGTVTFSSGSAVLCTANVSKGSASCSVSATSLNAGTYSITANFSGNATTAPSETSSSLVVSKAKSTLSLVLNKTKLPRSQVASIVASAVLSSPIGSTPPGLVTFTLDGKAIANNSSSLSFSSLAGLNLSAGTHVIEVTYGGSTNYLGSTAKATFTLS